MKTVTCQLPGGYLDKAGLLHQEVEIVPICGHEEEWFADQRNGNNAGLVTHILGRCVKRIGDITPVNESTIRGLLAGDRLYLMLKLREATFGERVMANLTCPWQDCAKKIDIDFSLTDLPVQESQDKRPFFTVEVKNPDNQTSKTLTYRLPKGADQESIAPIAREEPEQALSTLIGRCIQSIDGFEIKESSLDSLSIVDIEQIDTAMAAVAPKVDTDLNGICPECGREFTHPFDLTGFFFDELSIGLGQLYREVHYLAYHYHWSEDEILSLPRNKRRLYIELLSEQLEVSNYAFQ